ncbi:modulator of macroautophagy TMEM150B [Melanotaenia boesemani]|uniref:modulator of macroautophagy TMEM150B n=1 Tax=Melanotaenia boesemani TaxID=1250792 RepID=UPI001C04C039|nr:modulator of macroautophagy TMEM150B [Melanotaenia boesemani]
MWLWALPVCMAVIGASGFWTVFGMSVTNGSANLTKSFPMISLCANFNPQSCLFAQICNICSGLGLWIMLIRFQQIIDYGDHGKENTASVVCGVMSALGISVTGNFQSVHFQKLHFLGACSAFFFGLIYFWIQLYLTYRAQPSQDRYWVGPVRGICCTLSTLFFIAMSIFVFITYHYEAAVCEWALTMLFFVLFGLFAAEFRHIDCYRFTVQKQALKKVSSPLPQHSLQKQEKAFKLDVYALDA